VSGTGAQRCALEAKNNGSASYHMVGQGAPQVQSLGKDCKSQVVGRSRCRLACRIERWEATADDDWQQGTGTQSTPDHATSTLASDTVPHSLLDGGQVKITLAHQLLEDGQATDRGTNGSNGDGTSKPGNNGEGAASEPATATGNGAIHPTHQRDCIHPSDTSLSTNCVHLHPSEATPKPKG
jgi:hypothetical protein